MAVTSDILGTRPAMVERTIEYFSYGGLLLLLLLASLGLPIPEEIPIVTAGILSHQQVMRWWLAVSTCIVGVLAGDLILYGAGRHWGERVLEQRLLGRLLNRARLDQIEASYRRRGVLIVFLSRNVMGLRAAAFIAAGVVGVPLRKFLAADGAAIAYGVPLNFGIAYFFASHLKAVFEEVHRIERWIALVALIAGACWIYSAFRRRAERELARAAHPAP
jgi:membrane protein DedA with SNARE-associated domain